MKNYSKYFSVTVVTYLFLLVIESLVILFSIGGESSQSVTTLLGISIDNHVTAHEISTTFGLTPQIVVTFAIYSIFVSAIIYTFKRGTK